MFLFTAVAANMFGGNLCPFLIQLFSRLRSMTTFCLAKKSDIPLWLMGGLGVYGCQEHYQCHLLWIIMDSKRGKNKFQRLLGF